MFSKVDYVMVNVSDMRRSVEFYRDTLGLRLKFESPAWSEFETGATTLALHAGTKVDPVQDRPATAGICRPGFGVPDLGEFHKRMLAASVRCVHSHQYMLLNSSRVIREFVPISGVRSVSPSGSGLGSLPQR